MKNLPDHTFTPNDKQKYFNFLKKIGTWNKDKGNAFEIDLEYRGLVVEKLKTADITKDKYAELKIALSKYFKESLSDYLDKKIERDKIIMNKIFAKKQDIEK
ncbi:MAG: hypothetical protein GKC53_05390 [Neisseriaceae bacterium]|nr:MAG: hypothetical protein GKC53_05390 [Neisseriaceae bacterium]